MIVTDLKPQSRIVTSIGPHQFFQALFQALEDCSLSANYHYYRYLHALQLFQLFEEILVFVYLFNRFLSFLLRGLLEQKKITIRQILFFLLINSRSGLQNGFGWFICISKSQKIVYISFSKMDSGLCIYHSMVQFESLTSFPVDHFCRTLSYTVFVLVSCVHLLCD